MKTWVRYAAEAPPGFPGGRERDCPTPRQIDNVFASDLMLTQEVDGRLEYEDTSLRRIAALHGWSGGLWREIHATQGGAWDELWRVYRAFDEGGVVILANTALAHYITGWPRRTLQRALQRGELPCSEVGNTYFIPCKAAGGPGLLGAQDLTPFFRHIWYRHSLGREPTRMTVTETTDGAEAPVSLGRYTNDGLEIKAKTDCSGPIVLATLEVQPGTDPQYETLS